MLQREVEMSINMSRVPTTHQKSTIYLRILVYLVV